MDENEMTEENNSKKSFQENKDLGPEEKPKEVEIEKESEIKIPDFISNFTSTKAISIELSKQEEKIEEKKVKIINLEKGQNEVGIKANPIDPKYQEDINDYLILQKSIDSNQNEAANEQEMNQDIDSNEVIENHDMNSLNENINNFNENIENSGLNNSIINNDENHDVVNGEDNNNIIIENENENNQNESLSIINEANNHDMINGEGNNNIIIENENENEIEQNENNDNIINEADNHDIINEEENNNIIIENENGNENENHIIIIEIDNHNIINGNENMILENEIQIENNNNDNNNNLGNHNILESEQNANLVQFNIINQIFPNNILGDQNFFPNVLNQEFDDDDERLHEDFVPPETNRMPRINLEPTTLLGNESEMAIEENFYGFNGNNIGVEGFNYNGITRAFTKGHNE